MPPEFCPPALMGAPVAALEVAPPEAVGRDPDGPPGRSATSATTSAAAASSRPAGATARRRPTLEGSLDIWFTFPADTPAICGDEAAGGENPSEAATG